MTRERVDNVKAGVDRASCSGDGTAGWTDSSAHRDVQCTVCRARAARLEPFYYSWRARRWWIRRCQRCTHAFVYPPVTRAEQEVIYSDLYFSERGDWAEGHWASGYIGAEGKLREEARQVLDMLPRRPGRLLEIGCAGGFFLDEARRRGFDVAGVEFNVSMASHARQALGLAVIQAGIEDVAQDAFSRRFDVLVLMDVLEHIPDPYALFEKASRWLMPMACVLVRGPLENARVAKAKEWIRRRLWLEKQLPGYPLDANMFTKTSLMTLLELFGFTSFSWIGTTRDFGNLVAWRGAGSEVAVEAGIG